MRSFLIAAMVLTFLFSCKPGIPGKVIKPDKMEKILVEMHIADGYISTIPSQDSAKKVAAGYYQAIYKDFKIDSAIYSESLNYYYKNPGIFSEIYSKVLAELNKRTEKSQNKPVVDALPKK